jgi:hypothetical protein
LESDAEQQLIRFVEWLGHAGTLAPPQRAGYVSAVKAAHLLWFGCPYESFSHCKFFRLTRALDGMIMLHKGSKRALREGMLRVHFQRIFVFIDSEFTAKSDIYFVRPMEALLITMHVARNFPPRRVRPHSEEQNFPSHGPNCIPRPVWCLCSLLDPLQQARSITAGMTRMAGRMTHPGRTNPPVILAADHDDKSKRFSACFQLHALFNLMRPTEASLTTTPLFPTRAQAGPHSSPFDYDGLGKLVRRVMSWAFRCQESSPMLTPYTAYSLRIG